MSTDEFDSWLEQQDESPTDLGQEEWEGVCAKCHGLNGEGGIGPRIAGSPTLTDPEDLGNLVRSGRGAMPAVGADWTAAQVEALVDYLTENPPSGS
jgi:mono/diheme cytochrome c family protein